VPWLRSPPAAAHRPTSALTIAAFFVFASGCSLLIDDASFGEHVDGGVDAGMRDSGVDDAGTDAGAEDAGTDAASCGRFGEPCCGTECTEGACLLRGICATFGGAFQTNEDRSSCVVSNPLAAGACACSTGFVETLIGDEPYGFSGNPPMKIFICTAPGDVPRADYRGAVRNANGTGACARGCEDNPTTSECACPAGASGPMIELNGCGHTLNVCRGSDELLSFGGAYFTHTDESLASDMRCTEGDFPERCVANPITDDCSCPLGFTAERYRTSFRWVGTPGTRTCDSLLFICMRDPV
jgi:hypothetical protein